MQPKPGGHGKRKEPEGREIATFECKSSSESAAMATIPGSLAILGALASSLDHPSLVVVLVILAGLLPLIISLATSLAPRTKSTCTIKEMGIKLKAISPRSRPRFLPWRGLARFSSKPMGMKGGRIYLYPKGPLGLLRRVTIEPAKMSDYQLLYNHVSSRIGLF